MSIVPENLKAVTLNKVYIRFVILDVDDAALERFWIPTRKETLAILPMFK